MRLSLSRYAAALVLAAGCARPADQGAGATAAILAADSAWARAFVGKDTAGYLAFVDSEAVIQPTGAPAVRGREAIRSMVAGYWALPALGGTWEPRSAGAAGSGELGYSVGTYAFTWRDPSGHPAGERGKYLYVWRKRNGRWRMLVESFNPDSAAAP